MVLASDAAAWHTQPHCQLPWGPAWAHPPASHPLSSRHWRPHPPELPTLGLEREGLAQQGPQAGQVSSSWGLQGQGEGTLHRDGHQGLRGPRSHFLGQAEWRWWVSEAPGLRAQGLAARGFGPQG